MSSFKKLIGKHSIGAYSRTVKDFVGVLDGCPSIKEVHCGEYDGQPGRRRHVTVKPTKLPRRMVLMYRDSSGGYLWHIVVREGVTLRACRKEMEEAILAWGSDITFRSVEFPNEKPKHDNGKSHRIHHEEEGKRDGIHPVLKARLVEEEVAALSLSPEAPDSDIAVSSLCARPGKQQTGAALSDPSGKLVVKSEVSPATDDRAGRMEKLFFSMKDELSGLLQQCAHCHDIPLKYRFLNAVEERIEPLISGEYREVSDELLDWIADFRSELFQECGRIAEALDRIRIQHGWLMLLVGEVVDGQKHVEAIEGDMKELKAEEFLQQMSGLAGIRRESIPGRAVDVSGQQPIFWQ